MARVKKRGKVCSLFRRSNSISPTVAPKPVVERFIYKSPADSTLDECKKQLRQALQVAVALEFSTIPPYLTALYSLQDKSSDAYQIIRSVALEEMLHINLACNLMNAIAENNDQRPKFHGEVPIDKLSETYTINGPKKQVLHLPVSYPDELLRPILNGPRVQLMAASKELMQHTFMAIEQPEPVTPGQLQDGQVFDTIGQFYAAIEELFVYCNDHCTNLFSGQSKWQRTDFYFGSGGGKPIEVKDLKTAKEAIEQIKQQGEGALPPNTAYRHRQPYGTYNHYGWRSDGTYGPILGTSYELSHYFKFKAIADGLVPLPSVYPMLPNPSSDEFKNQDAKFLNEVFNLCYSLLVVALEKVFRDDDELYFSVVVTLMHSVFPALSTQLMQTPVLEDGDAKLGPTAGPSYKFNNIFEDSTGNISAVLFQLKEKSGEILENKAELSSPTIAALEGVNNVIDSIDEAISKGAQTDSGGIQTDLTKIEENLDEIIEDYSEESSESTIAALNKVQNAIGDIVEALKDQIAK